MYICFGSKQKRYESCKYDYILNSLLKIGCFKGIKELGQLSDCINLEILDLSGNELFDLTRLRSLRKLQYLNLSSNKIKNLGKNISF